MPWTRWLKNPNIHRHRVQSASLPLNQLQVQTLWAYPNKPSHIGSNFVSRYSWCPVISPDTLWHHMMSWDMTSYAKKKANITVPSSVPYSEVRNIHLSFPPHFPVDGLPLWSIKSVWNVELNCVLSLSVITDCGRRTVCPTKFLAGNQHYDF